MRAWVIGAGLALAGCAAPGAMNPSYDLSRVRRMAVWRFETTAPGTVGAEDLLIRRLLESGFRVIERAQLDAVLKEQGLGTGGVLEPDTVKKIGKVLGVDALFLGTATQVPERKQVILIPTHTRQEEPVIETVREKREGDVWVEVPKRIGTKVSHTKTEPPYIHTVDAQASVSLKLVDAETGEIIWAAAYAGEGANAHLAMESAVYYLAKTLRKQWVEKRQ